MKNNSLKFLFALLWLFCAGCKTDQDFSSIPLNSQQVVIVETDSKANTKAGLFTWELKNGHWYQVFGRMAAVVGRNGIAPIGEKREGDGRTPGGAYLLGTAFGYGPPPRLNISYHQMTGDDLWVDDAASPDYNRWVKAPTPAKSFEHMKRSDNLYKYGIVVEYNTGPIVPGNGSAIFMHVWRGPDSPTAGCVALAEKDLIRILKWLDFSKLSSIVLQNKKDK